MRCRSRAAILPSRSAALVPIAVKAMQEIEDAWARDIGAAELEHLRAALQRLCQPLAWQPPA